MRHLLTSLALLATFAAAGQVNGFQLPYNPDAEPDGFIGINDVLAILPLYGQSFISEGIYVNGDSTHVLMDMGGMSYPECEYTCKFTLPGSWRVSTLADLGAAWETAKAQEAWISMDEVQHHGLQVSYMTTAFADDGASGTQTTSQLDASHNCFCATHEWPKVEYLVLDPMESIYNDSAVEFEPWLNEKAQEGWKLMPTPAGYAEPGTWVVLWRWAE
jgi:hypothetical protein